jgi:hypothetical protein
LFIYLFFHLFATTQSPFFPLRYLSDLKCGQGYGPGSASLDDHVLGLQVLLASLDLLWLYGY